MKNKSGILVWLLITITVLVVYFSYKGRNKAIIQNKGETSGVIIDIKGLKAGGTDFVYEFILEGKRYRNSTSFGLCSDLVQAILGKSFPVVYDGSNPENSELLITKQSFDRFSIQQPDSLKWVNNYCN